MIKSISKFKDRENDSLKDFTRSLRSSDKKDGTLGNIFNNKGLNNAFGRVFDDNSKIDQNTRQSEFFGELVRADSENGIIGDIFDSVKMSSDEKNNIVELYANTIFGPLLETLGISPTQMQHTETNPVANRLQEVGEQAYPYDLNNYSITDRDASNLRPLGYNYNSGDTVNLNTNQGLMDTLNNDFGVYTSSEQMTPEQVQSITQGRVNTNIDPSQFGLTQEQVDNACIIASVMMEECEKAGKSPEETKRAIVIALATAMGESSLKNLPYGDRDSLGLFQQRPSCGWGTPEQVTDPVYATRKFASHLLEKDFMNMRVTEAAQSVQRSAFPEGYARYEDKARSLTEALLS